MKKLLIIVAFIASTIFAQAQITTVYINVNYVDLYKGGITKKVIVAKNKIGNFAIIKKIPKSKVEIIDGKEKYLMPSLYDMHVHWPTTLSKEYFESCTAAGVTNIRVMKSETNTIKEIKNIKNISFKVGYPFYSSYNLKNAIAFVDSIKKQGYNFIKFFSVKKKIENDFIKVAKAAWHKGIIICGHALGNVKMDTAFYYGYKSVEHVGYLDKLSDNALDSAIQKFKQYNVAVCPTLDWMLVAYGATTKEQLISRNSSASINAELQNHWDTLYKTPAQNFGDNATKYADFAKNSIAKKIINLKKLKEAGVKIIVGSDAEEAYQAPGFTLIEEMKHIAKAGFTNMEVLQMATVNAYYYWNIEIKKKVIHLNTLYDKNPLEDLNNLYFKTK